MQSHGFKGTIYEVLVEIDSVLGPPASGLILEFSSVDLGSNDKFCTTHTSYRQG